MCPSQVTDRSVESHDDHPTQLKLEPSQQSTVSAQIGQLVVLPSQVTQVGPALQSPFGLVQEMWYDPTSQVRFTVQVDLVWIGCRPWGARDEAAATGDGVPREARNCALSMEKALPITVRD